MLTEKRQEEILQILEVQGRVTVQELTERLDASESTIRRDLNVLDKKGALVKVFGGAVRNETRISTHEEQVALRQEQHRAEKLRIARYAASLIEPDDFIYIFFVWDSPFLSPKFCKAGLSNTFPSRSNREPWQGQSQLRSSGFHSNLHPM